MGNTSVYVTGLPKDVEVKELAEFFSKCGVLMNDIVTGKYSMVYLTIYLIYVWFR
jgi:RNA recognition motif-containing protein